MRRDIHSCFAPCLLDCYLDELKHDSQLLLGVGVEEAVLDHLDREGPAAGAVQGEVGEHVDGASPVVGVLLQGKGQSEWGYMLGLHIAKGPCTYNVSNPRNFPSLGQKLANPRRRRTCPLMILNVDKGSFSLNGSDTLVV